MGRREEIIRAEIDRRRIPYLLHFTPACNVPDILRFGLLSRYEARRRDDLCAQLSAPGRIDGSDDAISASVTTYYPEMFEAKRHRSGIEDWVFLVLDPDIMWRLECHFHPYGAGYSGSKSGRIQTGTLTAFRMMFDETDPYGRLPRGHYRPLNRIPDSLPTFPAAEVQVLDPVPVEDILGAFVPRAEWEKRLRPHFDAMPGPPREIVLAAEHGCYRVRDWCWGFPDPSEVPGAADRNEMRELYDACAHEEGEPAYLGDGVYIDLPED